MKAVVYSAYGPPDVLRFEEVDKPLPADNEVLVEIHAASINYGDLIMLRGRPVVGRLWSGLLKPKHKILGTDIAGRVEAVGRNVQRFQPGDEVFGDVGDHGFGAFAEYVAVPEEVLAHKPANMSFEQAAAAPQAAVVALQGLRDNGQIRPGQKVLINGASGGIGPFAVQIAKSYGTEVTAVCSTKNLDMVKAIGADHVIDYTKEEFTQQEARYDLIFDIVANRSVADYARALKPGGSYVACAFNPTSLFLGPLHSRKENKKISSLVHKPNKDDLLVIKELLEDGEVVPVIDRCCPINDVVDAFRTIAAGQARGKVIITMEHDHDS